MVNRKLLINLEEKAKEIETKYRKLIILLEEKIEEKPKELVEMVKRTLLINLTEK